LAVEWFICISDDDESVVLFLLFFSLFILLKNGGSMSDPILNVQDLTIKYDDKTAVDGISFHVAPGELIGFLGPNGSGKTSTIKAVMGINPNYSGTIELFGSRPSADHRFRSRIGYVPESSGFFEMLSGREFLSFSSMLFGLSDRDIRSRVQALADAFRLGDSLDKRIAGYSKGMRQKLLVVSALLHKPDLLLLDEPLDGLDAESIEILKRMLRLLADAGVAVLYSSHIMDVVETFSERIIVLNKGKILADGTLREVLGRSGAHESLSTMFQSLTGTVNPDEVTRSAVDALGYR